MVFDDNFWIVFHISLVKTNNIIHLDGPNHNML